MRRASFFAKAMAGLGLLLVVFLVLPVASLLAATQPSDFLAGLTSPSALSALRLSLFTTSITLTLVVTTGTPLAWWLARSSSRWARAVETVVQLPVVMPPAVAGVALLLAWGRKGVLLGWLGLADSSLAFSTAAVVMAEVFVSAPFFLQAATAAFRRLDPELLLVARSLGARPAAVFFGVELPLARAGLLSGAAMSWARSLGEFGATLMFAGSLEGATQTLPLAIYSALESDLARAQALSVVLVVVAFALLLVVRAADRRAQEAG